MREVTETQKRWDHIVWALRWRSQNILEAPGVRCIQLDSGMGLLQTVEKDTGLLVTVNKEAGLVGLSRGASL